MAELIWLRHIFSQLMYLNQTCPRLPWLHWEHPSPYLVGTHRTLTSPWNSPSRPRIMYVTRRKYHYPNSDFMAIRPHHRSVLYLCWSLTVKNRSSRQNHRCSIHPDINWNVAYSVFKVHRGFNPSYFSGGDGKLPIWCDFWKFFWKFFLRVQNWND